MCERERERMRERERRSESSGTELQMGFSADKIDYFLPSPKSLQKSNPGHWPLGDRDVWPHKNKGLRGGSQHRCLKDSPVLTFYAFLPRPGQ